MLIDNSVCGYENMREDGVSADTKETFEKKEEEGSMFQSILLPFVGERLCYESFFMDCLSRPSICSGLFVSAFGRILEHLSTLQSCSLFVQERDTTYLFNGLVFLYAECGCSTFKSRFINALSTFFVKRGAAYAKYQFLHRYNAFKALLPLIKQGDFRIREFVYNTDFVDVLFELPNDDPMILALRWKFINIIATSADIKSNVLERESIKSFLSSSLTTSFGAVNSLVKDTLQNAKKGAEHVFRGFT